MSKLTDTQAALTAYLDLPAGLVEVVSEGFPPPKSGASGPGDNKKKQLKEFPFGGEEKGAAGGDEKSGPGGAMGPGGQPMLGDEAAKQMQQQQADRERAEMQARQANDAEDEAERERLKKLRSAAEKSVSDDLNDKYLDTDDKVEFYPRLESFLGFVKEEETKPKYVECPMCDGEGDAPVTAKNASGNCPKCHGGGKIPLKEAKVDPSDKCDICGKSPAPIYAAGRDNSQFLCRKCAKEAGIKEEAETISCPSCHRKFKVIPDTGIQFCPHCKQDVILESYRTFPSAVLDKCRKYVDGLKNADKQAYARACIDWVARGKNADDIWVDAPKGLSYSAAQAVRNDVRGLFKDFLLD